MPKKTKRARKPTTRKPSASKLEQVYRQFFGDESPAEHHRVSDADQSDRVTMYTVRQFATYGAFEEPI